MAKRLRNVRVDDEVWAAAKARAFEDRRKLSFAHVIPGTAWPVGDPAFHAQKVQQLPVVVQDIDQIGAACTPLPIGGN